MNKKGQQNAVEEKVLLIIIAVILSSVLIYFLGNLAIWLGIGSILISFILFYIASQTNEDQVGYTSLFFLVLGIILLIGGLAITSFFKSSDIGRTWLSGGKTIINSTTETYKIAKGGLN